MAKSIQLKPNPVVTVISSGMSKELEQFSTNAPLFSMDLYSQVRESEQGKNLIFSPFSIKICVALAYIGAGGKTATEIAKGLRLQDSDSKVVGELVQHVLDTYTTSEDSSLKIANKFYLKTGYEVQDEFNQIATKNFYSEAENINFEEKVNAAGAMNKWVEEKTNEKIKNLISEDDLDEDTRMVLINAIHFKGEWNHRFEKDETHKEDFWISETDSVQVDMMNTKAQFNYGTFEELDATAIEVPYKKGFSMFVLLPNSRTGLKALEEKIRNLDLYELTQELRNCDVTVKFPKFKTELQLNLNDTLEKMGMGDMFSNTADFSGLLKSSGALKVSKVIHKAFIEVNEDGTEAAAATVKKWRQLSSRCDSSFIADRPFIYAIKDSDDRFIFIGTKVKQ